jgi:hypothetical protein
MAANLRAECVGADRGESVGRDLAVELTSMTGKYDAAQVFLGGDHE